MMGRRTFKGLVVFIISATMVFAFCGCGSPSPTETVDSFLTAVKAQDASSLAGIYENADGFNINESDLSDLFASDDSEASEEYVKIGEDLMAKILDFDYELSNEQITDDSATVDVTVKTYDIGTGITKLFNEYITQAFMLAFDDDSDEKLDKLGVSLFQTMISDLDEKSYEKTATLNLKKVDGNWVVSEIDEEGDFMNAISGGLLDALKTLEETWGE